MESISQISKVDSWWFSTKSLFNKKKNFWLSSFMCVKIFNILVMFIFPELWWEQSKQLHWSVASLAICWWSSKLIVRMNLVQSIITQHTLPDYLIIWNESWLLWCCIIWNIWTNNICSVRINDEIHLIQWYSIQSLDSMLGSWSWYICAVAF